MSVPSLESLLAEYIATQAPVSVEQAMPQAEDMAKLIRAHGLDRTSGLNAAADVVHAEARYQWEMDARHAVCAQVVAQRMGVVERTIRSFADGAEDQQ
ncbi:hypothetical protein [Gordonia westfalica]|uniref:Uncharacterized protein n=1 Tax=Gordonia westfalica TaxID=158898 RepID=A0A1H2DR74_9ACTN|nr:hypothetical protein [Gordonia westfalica]SDT84452.1 hypothetical protein SAMN04488548_1093 [Gordonia westfalica]SDT84484.1 hypothetical protein SAMN04488548_10920 [Gordonia westfalica]SDT84505.1 hypothetical protein SAMN04488548_10931 [Gordonia westfalica]SDT84567.1 hypothetical protein SAMN04488548_10955 [Gordonia westfalica]SDT85316.1 hypothetical protein SAMN04488548_11843 [Gordonia westfalica]